MQAFLSPPPLRIAISRASQVSHRRRRLLVCCNSMNPADHDASLRILRERISELREHEVERDRQLAHNWRTGGFFSNVVAAVTDDYVRRVSFDADYLAFGTAAGGVVFSDMNTGFRLKCESAHVGQVTAIDYKDSYIVSVGSMDRQLALWNVAEYEKPSYWQRNFSGNPKLEHTLPEPSVRIEAHNDIVTSIQIDVRRNRIYSASVDGTINVADLEGKHIRTIRVGEPIFCMLFTEKEHLLVGCKSGRVQAYAENGLYLLSILCHKSNTTALDYCDQGELLVTGDSGGNLSLWSLRDGKFIASLPSHDAAVMSVQCDGFKVVSAGRDGSIAISGVECHTRFYSIGGFTKYLASARFDEARLITDGTNDVVVCHRFDQGDDQDKSP